MLPKKLKHRGLPPGFTMVEVMIALSMVGLLSAAIMTIIGSMGSGILSTKATGARDEIARSIEHEVKDLKAIVGSARPGSSPGNAELLRCLDSGGGLCTVTDPNAQATFKLFQKGTAAAPISGTGTAPVLYDRLGAFCTPTASATCGMWQATTYFWATCPGKTASCAQASTIHIRYQVVPSVATYQDRTLTPYPREPEFSTRPAEFATTHQVYSGIQAAQNCPTDTEQTGYLADGKISCRCRLGFAQTGLMANGMPVCASQAVTCPPSHIIQGRDAKGRPICRLVVRQCSWIGFGNGDATCPNGGWLENIDLGTCRAGTGAKKGGSRPVACDNNKGYCCWYEPS